MSKETAKQDLQAIINDAATKEGVDPELMQKIGGSESAHKATAKNPKSTAKGLFQFVDKTWKEMGGKPGQQYDPYKNAELGARYVKQNQQALQQALGRDPSHGEVYAAHVFGPTGAKALLTKADPNAPIEQSLALFESPKRVQKVLKQNPNLQGKTTAQVLASLEAKMGGKKPQTVDQEPVTPAPAKSSPGWFRSPVPHFIRSEAPNLGTGYNAALALMGMSDKDELEKAQELVAQEQEDNAALDFGQAKQMLANVQAPNAFAKQQPRMLASGGEVRHMASGGFMVPFQTNILRQPDKAYLDESQQMWDTYNTQASAYNTALEKYNTEVYTPYTKQMDVYNAALKAYNESAPVVNYNAAADAYNAKVEAYNAAPWQTIATQVYYGGAPGGPGYLGNRYVYYRASGPGQEQAFQPGYQFVNTNPAVPYFGNIQSKNVALPGTFDMKAPDPFGMTAPTTPNPFDQTAPTAPSRTQEQILAYQRQALGRAQEDARNRGLAIEVANDPEKYNVAGFGSSGINAPSMFAEGGEATAEPEKGSAKAMLKEVGRSTQYAPADLAGSPVDLLNLGLKGVDALTGSKLAQEMPVGGSEWLIDKANKLGLMDKPTGSTTESVTRMAMGVASPTAGPRALITAGKAVKGTAKAALEDLSMAATGQGGSSVAQKFATATGLEPKFASRPKGGVSLGASSAADVPLTRVDERLKQTIEGIDTNTEQGQAVAGFFDKKMRNYYQNQHGTPDDPLYKAILEGRIQPSIANPRVIDAARAGDPKALQDLRRAYDASTNIQALGSKTVLKEQGRHAFDMEGDIRKLIKEQSPGEDTLMATAVGLDPKELERYSTLYSSKGYKDIVSEGEAGKLLRLLNKTDLQPHVRQAVAKGEPIYAVSGNTSRMLPVDEIRDYLFTRTPAEIKNMGVVDAAVKAKQWHLKMAEARKNPEKFGRKELFSGTEQVLPVETGTWVDVKTPDALSLEGNIMGHCVGGSNYCNAVAQDKTKIISLRDKKGIPHVTIQLEKTPEGFTRVAQIKGTANNSPEKYFGEINAFLDDYSSKLGKNLTITERPSFVPPQWRDK